MARHSNTEMNVWRLARSRVNVANAHKGAAHGVRKLVRLTKMPARWLASCVQLKRYSRTAATALAPP